MPIHANTYRHYEGRRRGRPWRAFVIAASGTSLAVRKKSLVALVLLGIVPSVIFGVLVYGSVSMNAAEYEGLAAKLLGDTGWRPFLDRNPGPAGAWKLIFSTFLIWQLVPVVVLVTAVGPALISEDLRARALQLYYSRPLTRADYLVGKLLVVAVFVAMVTLVPALLLWLVGVVLSRSPVVVLETWRTLAGIVLGSALVALVAGVLVLACSSLSRRSSHVAVAWASLVVLSESVYVLVRDSTGARWSYLFSLRTNVAQAIASLFGAPREYDGAPAASWAILAAVVVAAVAFLYRRTAELEGEH